jgi:hypothetical protein
MLVPFRYLHPQEYVLGVLGVDRLRAISHIPSIGLTSRFSLCYIAHNMQISSAPRNGYFYYFAFTCAIKRSGGFRVGF